MSEEQKQIERDTKKRWYVIDIQNTYKLYWDGLVILCAAYAGFTAPIEIAFEEVDDVFASSLFLHILDVVVDFIFIIDIVAGFLTAYTDTYTGDTIRNPRRIAIRYLKSGFVFDLLSSLPFAVTPVLTQLHKAWPDFAAHDAWIIEALSLCRIFKLVRLRKIDQVIANMHSSKGLKT